jgi:hypothetical protein
MTRRVRLLILVPVGLLLVGGIALTRPTPPYAGRVLYLNLRLSPYVGSTKYIRYWIDPAAGRIRYEEMMPQSGVIRATVNGVPVMPAAPKWSVVSLARQADGRCAITYTTILDSSERGQELPCSSLLALHDEHTLRSDALVLLRRYGGSLRTTDGTARVQLPAGTDLVPLLMEHFNMRYGYETMRPGLLVLDKKGGRPLSISGYVRDGQVMTERIVSARLLPPNSLPGDFFDAPRFSLPDRMPAVYRWLQANLPWHP